ncbi:MAG TPA: carbamoyltransferase HypF [Acidimicrobiia bacterium]|nr:carbamoyltransferase HypF [Acidimicrobiia bacterium]
MATRRAIIEIHGAVQGVGFRPFVYRLATEMDLRGWVLNDARGVFIEVDGDMSTLEGFIARLEGELPAVASIDTVDVEFADEAGFASFEIRHSDTGGARTAIILPDLATCVDCRNEVFDEDDRRWGYPFTNCTNCGPRFSIIRDLPYDRPNTTMVGFVMCEACQSEYGDPANRRFHAQPNACPDCGPTLSWTIDGSRTVASGRGALEHAVATLGDGGTIALKGIGGYQLIVDASNAEAVARLRVAKSRPTKPFAVMVRTTEEAGEVVELDDEDRRALTSPQSPIVLARRAPQSTVVTGVAPSNPTLGVMLPTTPLHHLLIDAFGGPLVATSGNRSDEPIATDDEEAFARLGSFADGFLVHDRPIERHVDDSVVWTVDGHSRILRRARGYAPMPIALQTDTPPIVAMGAHLKNTIAVSVGRNVFVSQHIGDLETEEANHAFVGVIDDIVRMYDVQPEAVAHDLHPDYRSTIHALSDRPFGPVPTIAVQHHHAHLASCLADNAHPGPALGVTWDGTGYGTDGTIWGGEFLLGDAHGYERVAHLRAFRLPGGDAAAREPRRSAAAVLVELGMSLSVGTPGVGSFDPAQLRIIARMLETGFHAPVTTSAGRLFDAVAAIVGLMESSSFEGEAAMALEHVADPGEREPYPMPIVATEDAAIVDWGPTILAILDDLATGAGPDRVSGRFHATLATGITEVADFIGHPVVALTGGCFQNRLLTESTARQLRRSGFEVLMHRRVPPNDGGISLGQVAVASASRRAVDRHRPSSPPAID